MISPSSLLSILVMGAQPLRPFFESIIQKRVNTLALTVFESIVNFLCKAFYAAYNERLAYCSLYPNATSQKILQFMDGTLLFDTTSTLRLEIKQSKKTDEIFVDGKKIYFCNNPMIPLRSIPFFKTPGTQEMYATDTKECPEIILLYERNTNGKLKTWSVDTSNKNHPHFLANEIQIAG